MNKSDDFIYAKYTFITFLVILFLGVYNSCEAQTYNDTIAYDCMEDFSWSGNWWAGASTTGFYTNASKSEPASAVIYGSGGGADEYDWYVLPNIDTLDPMQQYKVQINLGSYKFTSTGPSSGVDSDDYIDIQVSIDGGVTYNSEIRITGNNNAYWAYNSATVSKVVNGSLETYTPNGGGDRTLVGDGFSIIELTFPIGVTQIAIDVLAVVDRAGEEWWLDDFFLLGSGSGFALPIELSSFSAEADGTSVNVDWVVHSQVNNDYYTIERSLDCFTWEEVVRVEGDGNSNSEKQYQIKDENPHFGTSYYRLKQTDYDGKSETFNPVSVQVENKYTIGLKIKPNPAIDYIELEIPYTDHPLINHDIKIFDTKGNTVYKKHFIGEIDNFQIDVKKLKPGYYILKSKSDNIEGSGKFLKE